MMAVDKCLVCFLSSCVCLLILLSPLDLLGCRNTSSQVLASWLSLSHLLLPVLAAGGLSLLLGGAAGSSARNTC